MILPIFFLLSAWTTEVVTTGPAQDDVLLAIDSFGKPYIVVTEFPFLLLFYKNNGAWIADTFEVNECFGEANGTRDLAIGRDNQIWCIYTGYNSSIETYYQIVAHKDSLAWRKDTVEFYGPSTVSPFTHASIVTDYFGNPHITYTDSVSYSWAWLGGYYAYLNHGIWEKTLVDSFIYFTYGGAIDLDSNNNPHISYFRGVEGINEHLWHAQKYLTFWYREEVEHRNYYADLAVTSIKLGQNNLPQIAYTDASIDTCWVKFAWYDGTLWHIETVATEASIGTQKALDIDSSSKPYILHFDIEYPTGAISYKDTGVWHKVSLPSLDPPLTFGFPGSLRIGRDGTIHVTRLATNDDYTYREIHYIYGTIVGIEEGERLKAEGGRLELDVLPSVVRDNARIQFTIPEKQSINLKLYDIIGREVLVITGRLVNAGNHSYSLNTSNLSSGIYFLVLEGEKESKIEKFLIVR